ncbi:MAG TPA: hypothetical protein VF011_18930 [Terriglobales bacterium]
MLDEHCPFYGLQVNERGIEKLAGFLAENKAEVLIIDNLGWFVPGDLNDPEDIKDFYQSLRNLRMLCDTLNSGFILLLHHLTKPGEKSSRPSLLTAPREYLSQARGSQRLLDFAECRLALAEEMAGDQLFHVVNGVNRTGTVEPMVMHLGFESLSFEIHEDSKLRYEQAFTGRPKQKRIYETLPAGEFTWTQALGVTLDGKPVSPDTLNSTLRTAVLNDFIVHDSTTKQYRKVFQP